MKGIRKDEEEIQDDLVVEVVLMVNFPLVPFLLVSFPCSSCADDFPAKKKVNNHIVEMQKDPTSCLKTIEKTSYTAQFQEYHIIIYFRGTRSPGTCHPALPPGLVQPLSKKFFKKSSQHGVIHGAGRPPKF